MNTQNFTDLDFCKVYHSKRDASIQNKKIIRIIKKAFKYNQIFFNRTIPKFKIIFIYSRKTMDFLLKCKTPDYVVSFTKRTRIIIFSPDIFEKESCWKKSDFYSTLVHEISHLFFTEITKSYEPLWLSEGIATFLQHNKQKAKNKRRISHSNLINGFYKNPMMAYDVSSLFVYYLIMKYKKKNLLFLLERIRKNKNIEESIKSIYGKNLRGLIKDANKI